jgi:hypothetical protein
MSEISPTIAPCTASRPNTSADDAGQLRLELQRLVAAQGPSRATLQGWAQRDAAAAPWHTQARLTVDEFDLQPWWPALPWRQASRLNAQAHAALTLPPAAPGLLLWDWLPSLQGRAELLLQRQGGDLQMVRGTGRRALGLDTLQVSVQADGTAWTAEARVAGATLGSLTARLHARTTPSDPWPGTDTPV